MRKRIFSSLISNFCSQRIKIIPMAEIINHHLQNSSADICCSPLNAENSKGKSCETFKDQSKPMMRKRLKRKLQKNDSTDDDVIQTNVRPNYFVAVQVSDHAIHEKIKSLQKHMLQQDNRLEDIMIDPSTLHITLMVMHIKDKETHTKALKALGEVHKEFNETMCSDPVTLNFSGLGHFNNRVLFAKVKENNSLDHLKTLVESVKTHFAEENIFTTDTRDTFNPHLTIAKIRFKCIRKIKKINPSLYKDFVDEEIGSQTIKGIQLLSMTDPYDDNGYYTGDEVLFSL